MDYARLRSLIYAWYDREIPWEENSIRFGENVHFSPAVVGTNATTIVDAWYFDQEPNWNYEDPYLSEQTNAFSQIVWKESQQLGCGQAASRGSNGGTYTVCFYDPPGNIDGHERENVNPPMPLPRQSVKERSGCKAKEEAKRIIASLKAERN
jgi:hypothetical protein